MRVISGTLKGRIVRTPPGRQVRPTQGHVRQVLFDVVGAGIIGQRVIDLFSGSGAIGIEALSRGATEVCFVERSPSALRCLRMNLENLGLTERARVLAVPVSVGLKVLKDSEGSWGWLFADPPYGTRPEDWMLQAADWGPGAILEEDGTLVLELSCRQKTTAQIGRLHRTRTHRVGETCLEFFQWDGRSHEADGNIPGDV